MYNRIRPLPIHDQPTTRKEEGRETYGEFSTNSSVYTCIGEEKTFLFCMEEVGSVCDYSFGRAEDGGACVHVCCKTVMSMEDGIK